MAYGIVYCLIDITSDREYVGQTVKTAEKRFKEHAREEYYIGRAIRDIGAENFLIVILKECDSKAELDYWEKHFIKSRDTMSPNGYNLTEGGEGGKMCPEVCAKISATKTGQKLPPEVIAKLVKANTGKKLSPEHCAKIGAAHKGKKKSPEWCAKIGMGNKGKKHSIEQTTAQRKPSPYEILRSEIEKRALTYTGIAKAIGITHGAFSDKMRGKYNFTSAQKIAIKNFLGVEMSVEELFAREDD